MRPKEVAERLRVPATTLRLWSNEFKDYLSPSAQAQVSEKGTALQRRYDDRDVLVFTQVKELLGQDLTYEQVRERLAGEPPTEETALLLAVSVPESPSNGSALATANGYGEVVDLLRRHVALQEETLALLKRRLEPEPGLVERFLSWLKA